VAGRMDVYPWLRRGPMTPYRGHRRVHAHGGSARGHRHPRFGEPARPAPAFYRAVPPRSYLGWGKSHALGTGLGLSSGPSSPPPTSSASTSWATPLSA
jgi:hypothetical protein